ncbi:hypothetical protein I3843_09G218900 [Carya illinoinensis]|nr:hypothetical protein I3843_09G218900 [Carya illinoinensis]
MISTREPHTGTIRGFIDAWSEAVIEENIANSSTSCSISSNGLLLTLSMGGSNSIDKEMGQLQMGSGLIGRNRNNESGSKSDISSWYTPASSISAPTPGGPLAEVLMPSMVAITTGAASIVSSPTPRNGVCGVNRGILVYAGLFVIFMKCLRGMSLLTYCKNAFLS